MLLVRRHEPFEDLERSEMEDRAIRQVETDPDTLFRRYVLHPGSLGGRYVNSDLFKEVFPEYSAGPEYRAFYNVPLHNSAAVLANELFHRRVAAKDVDGRTKVLFVTGIPGAGKTTSIHADASCLSPYKVIYEGQLSTFSLAQEKISFCLSHGCTVDVVAMHRAPEDALRNTFIRFNTIGRGASVSGMAAIQGGLGPSIEKLYGEFHRGVVFFAMDLRKHPPVPTRGREAIEVLKSEGDTDAIRKRLEAELDEWRTSGRISEACWREAAGRRPFAPSGIEGFHGRPAQGGCQTQG